MASWIAHYKFTPDKFCFAKQWIFNSSESTKSSTTFSDKIAFNCRDMRWNVYVWEWRIFIFQLQYKALYWSCIMSEQRVPKTGKKLRGKVVRVSLFPTRTSRKRQVECTFQICFACFTKLEKSLICGNFIRLNMTKNKLNLHVRFMALPEEEKLVQAWHKVNTVWRQGSFKPIAKRLTMIYKWKEGSLKCFKQTEDNTQRSKQPNGHTSFFSTTNTRSASQNEHKKAKYNLLCSDVTSIR